MRGSTLKKIRQFVDILIEQTPPDQLDKTKQQIFDETCLLWKSQGKQAQKFIDYVIKGKDFSKL